MSLHTQYLGLPLVSPIVVGASPLTDDLDMAVQLEAAGAGALVMRSLFMEQLIKDQLDYLEEVESYTNSFAEAASFFPELPEDLGGLESYLAKLKGLKNAVQIPVIASLNGVLDGPWVRYAKQLAEAGADALELNIYHLPTKGDEDGPAVEARTTSILKSVKEVVQIPVAVKLLPYLSSPIQVVRDLVAAGADGVVLFNRLYLPDFDVDQMKVVSRIHLSSSADLSERLLWLAALHGKVEASLVASGGVRSGEDAFKAIVAGAGAVQVVGAALLGGAGAVTGIVQELTDLLEAKGFHSVEEAKGSLSLSKVADPEAFERANYLNILHSWR